MSYYYLLGYMSETKHGTQHVGNTCVKRATPILTSKDVEESAESLRKDFEAARVILLSFSPLKEI